jgi:hypothetical protein
MGRLVRYHPINSNSSCNQVSCNLSTYLYICVCVCVCARACVRGCVCVSIYITCTIDISFCYHYIYGVYYYVRCRLTSILGCLVVKPHCLWQTWVRDRQPHIRLIRAVLIFFNKLLSTFFLYYRGSSNKKKIFWSLEFWINQVLLYFKTCSSGRSE